MPGRFDAVVFDFSGVMTSSAFAAMLDVVVGDVEPSVALEVLMGPYHQDTDHPWHRVERGEIPILEWVTWVDAEARRHGFEIDFAGLRNVLGDMQVHEVMVDRARSLRGDGYRVALLTNNVAEGSDAWRRIVPVDELFEVVVDSSEVGMRKPDPAIYRHTLDLLDHVAPARAVFLDDHPGNIAGAEAVGMAAILVDDPADAVAELDRLLAV